MHFTDVISCTTRVFTLIISILLTIPTWYNLHYRHAATIP